MAEPGAGCRAKHAAAARFKLQTHKTGKVSMTFFGNFHFVNFVIESAKHHLLLALGDLSEKNFIDRKYEEPHRSSIMIVGKCLSKSHFSVLKIM